MKVYSAHTTRRIIHALKFHDTVYYTQDWAFLGNVTWGNSMEIDYYLLINMLSNVVFQ